ncbi:hypothetical protein ACFO26_04630, partial [Lactococcus nasutitermitis]
SSASQAELTGKYNIPKRIITVHYTRRQAEITLYFIDDRGQLLGHQTYHNYENNEYLLSPPHYPYLSLVNTKLQTLKGTYSHPQTTIIIEYKHIPAYLTVNLSIDGQVQSSTVFDGYWGDSYYYPISPLGVNYLMPYPGYSYVSGRFNAIYNSVTLNYYYVRSTVTLNLYGTDGTYLTSYSQSGEYGQLWSFNLPSWIGNYQLAMNANQSGNFGLSNQSYTLYYSQVVPVATQVDYTVRTTRKKKVPKRTGLTEAQYMSKEGMLEYGDDSSTMKQYLEYAYMNEPVLEEKVATEYHDSKPAPYYGVMSVGNSTIAQNLRTTRQTVTNVVKQNIASFKLSASHHNVVRSKTQTKNKSKTKKLIGGLLAGMALLGGTVAYVGKKIKNTFGEQTVYADDGEPPYDDMEPLWGPGGPTKNQESSGGNQKEVIKGKGSKSSKSYDNWLKNSTDTVKHIYNSIKEAPKYPKDFEPAKNGSGGSEAIKNKDVIDMLKKLGGKWVKTYKNGYDAEGHKISIHYFQNKSNGKVFNVKVKDSWSIKKSNK